MNLMAETKALAKNLAAHGKLRMTPSEAFVETLVAQGVKDTFGIVGSAYMDAHDLFMQGPSGIAPPEQQTDEASFAKHVAQRLNHGALHADYADLVLVADPQTLGLVRPQLHKETLDRLRGEVAKTLTNARLEDITSALD